MASYLYESMCSTRLTDEFLDYKHWSFGLEPEPGPVLLYFGELSRDRFREVSSAGGGRLTLFINHEFMIREGVQMETTICHLSILPPLPPLGWQIVILPSEPLFTTHFFCHC